MTTTRADRRGHGDPALGELWKETLHQFGRRPPKVSGGATWDQVPQWDLWCQSADPWTPSPCREFAETVYDPETAAEKIDAHNAQYHPDEPPAVVV